MSSVFLGFYFTVLCFVWCPTSVLSSQLDNQKVSPVTAGPASTLLNGTNNATVNLPSNSSAVDHAKAALTSTSTLQPPMNNTVPGLMAYIKDKNGAVLRAFLVVVGVTAIVVIYFVVKAVRLRRKRSKSRKYGIITKSGDLEMTPLDQEDDDEDMTVFEAPNYNRK